MTNGEWRMATASSFVLKAYPKTAGDCPNFAESSEQNGTVPNGINLSRKVCWSRDLATLASLLVAMAMRKVAGLPSE